MAVGRPEVTSSDILRRVLHPRRQDSQRRRGTGTMAPWKEATKRQWLGIRGTDRKPHSPRQREDPRLVCEGRAHPETSCKIDYPCLWPCSWITRQVERPLKRVLAKRPKSTPSSQRFGRWFQTDSCSLSFIRSNQRWASATQSAEGTWLKQWDKDGRSWKWIRSLCYRPWWSSPASISLSWLTFGRPTTPSVWHTPQDGETARCGRSSAASVPAGWMSDQPAEGGQKWERLGHAAVRTWTDVLQHQDA